MVGCKYPFLIPFCLPYGKADGGPSPVLPRDRGNDYSFTLGRLGAGPPSTFAQLGSDIFFKQGQPQNDCSIE